MTVDFPVTIVVPVYNRSDLIGRCLDSVRAQTFRPLRLIIVDNNSTDCTPETVEKWIKDNGEEALKVELLKECKRGASAARNRGLAEVTSPYTFFFDSDDVMHPGLIETALNAIGDADIVYWKTSVIGLDGVRRPKPFYRKHHLQRHIFNAQFSTQQYLARTELFRRVGGWNEHAMAWNDWELGCRLLLENPRIVAVPRELVTIYAQADSITGLRFHDRKGERENTIALLESLDSSVLRRYLPYIKSVLAAHYRHEGFDTDAEALLAEATRRLPTFHGKLLRLLHRYTARGGRAAYYAWWLLS